MPKRCGYLCLSSISLDSYEVTKLHHKRAGSLIIAGSQNWSWKTSCPTYIRVFRSLTHMIQLISLINSPCLVEVGKFTP